MIRLPTPPAAYAQQWANQLCSAIEREFRDSAAAGAATNFGAVTISDLTVTSTVSFPAASIPVADLAITGTANSAFFLRGDAVWSNTLLNDIVSSGGHLRTRAVGGTGGGNVYTRDVFAGGSLGGFHIQGLAGAAILDVMPDAVPATQVIFSVGSGVVEAFRIAVTGAVPSFTVAPAFPAGVRSPLTIQLAAGSGPGVLNLQQSGLGNAGAINGLNSAGTLISTLAFPVAGGINVTNPSGVNIPFNVTGWSGGTLGQTIGTEFNVGTVGAAGAIDWNTNGSNQRLTLTSATACTLTFTAPPAPCWLTLKTISPAAGTVPAITWPATVKWTAATKPVQATTLGRANVQRLYWDGTNYWGDGSINNAA